MHTEPPARLSVKGRPTSHAIDGSSPAAVSRNDASLVNAPPRSRHSTSVAVTPSHKTGDFLVTVDAPKPRQRRGATPRGIRHRSGAGGDGGGPATALAQLPATITNARTPVANSRVSATKASKASGVVEGKDAAIAPGAPAKQATTPQAKTAKTRSPAAAPPATSPVRPVKATVSTIRPRSSVAAPHLDAARPSDHHTPVQSLTTPTHRLSAAHSGADVAHSSVQSTPVSLLPSNPATPAAPAAHERVNAVRMLATPRASTQDMTESSPHTPAQGSRSTGEAAYRSFGDLRSDGPDMMSGKGDGAPTALNAERERATASSADHRRLSGAVFSLAPGSKQVLFGPTGRPVTPRRPSGDGVVQRQHTLPTAKELRRRAASAGPTSRSGAVPALNLQRLHEPYERDGSSPLPVLRDAAHQRNATDSPRGAADDQEDSLSLSPPATSRLPDMGGDFLTNTILAINEVHAMDALATVAAGGDAGRLSGSAPLPGGVSRSFLQRGASTPRGYSPRPEATLMSTMNRSSSPVTRVLRGRTETSAAATPRLSTSTPRFTVATNTSTLPYTARQSREGTPIAGALLPTAHGATYPGGLGDGQRLRTPRQSVPPSRASPAREAGGRATDMNPDSQDYVAAVAEQLARHYYVILTAADIGRGAALQADPPTALCLRSMLIDLNTVASLLSYNTRHGIHDLLFDDCAFATRDLAWLGRLTQLTALRFKGARMTSATMNRVVKHAPTVQTVSFISTARVTSLECLVAPSSLVHTAHMLQTDFAPAAFGHLVNCPTLRRVMLLQVELRTNIFDLLNTNHIAELHLVGCPDLYYEELPEAEWVSTCSPWMEALAMPAEEPSRPEQQEPAVPERKVRTIPWADYGQAKRSARKPRKSVQPRRMPVFPLRTLVIADCPGLRLSTVPFDSFTQLEEVSVMYQRGVRAADLAGVLARGKLSTLRLQEIFVDEDLIQQLQRCTGLQELNLSFCRGMRGIAALWPALADSLRVLNVSYSEVDDEGLAGLGECRMLCNVYARGCSRLRSCDTIRRLSASVGVLDLTDCSGIEGNSLMAALDCTAVHRLRLDGCSKVRGIAGIASLRMCEELSLAQTSIDDTCFAALAADSSAIVLQTLTRLDLSGCRHIGALADFAALSTTALRNLTQLSLSRSSVTNAGLANLARVVAGGAGCLAEVDLSGCRAVSQLAPLGAVTSLRVLDASFSAVDDAGLAAFVRSSVASFSRELRVLDLHGCTGLADAGCLGQLPRLTVLSLSGTTIDGPATLAGLASCVGLQELDLSECPQLTSVAQLVPRLSKLRWLNLSLTGVKDDSVEALGSLAALEVLQLSGCRGVTEVTALGDLPWLQRLNLSATHVSDLSPLPRCPQLWDLSVCACPLLTSLQPLADAVALQRLDASETPITADSFLSVWSCATLEEMDLHNCRELRSIAAGALRKLVSLRRVNCSGTQLDDTAVAALAECENLCDVQLCQCPVSSLSRLGAVPTLQCIDATETHVTDDGLSGLEASDSLSALNLSGCRQLHDVSVLRGMRCLTTLNLSSSGVADVSFSASWSSSGLRELNVSGCAAVQEPLMLHTLPGLELLRATGSGLTDAGLRRLAECSTLRRLNVAECAQLTDLSPLAALTRLTHLDASQTPIHTLAPAPASPPPAASDSAELHCHHEGGDEEDSSAPTKALSEWTAASRLRHVKLCGCAALADVSALRHLTQLITADFSGSGLTEASFAASWASCVSLEEVTLTDCSELRCAAGLWAAPHLMQARLDGAALEALDGAAGCASLEVLDVSRCGKLRGIAAVRALPRLQQLQCRESAIVDDDSFAQPWTAPNLSAVDFSGCPHMRDVTALGSLPRLRSAVFAGTPITDVGVRALCTSPLLEEVDVRGCTRLAHLSSLSRLPRIRALYLSDTCVDNFTFTSLSRCRGLEVLEMERCPYVTSVFVVFELGQLRLLKFPPLSRLVGAVLHACRNLECLSLHGCPATFEIESLAALPRLRVLDMRESAIQAGVLAALNDCPCLEELDVSYCSGLTSLDAMGRLPRLRCLAAAGLPVTDGVCDKLVQYALLEKVVLAECHLLRDVSALRGLPQLHHLDVSESGVTEDSFVGIRAMRALEELSVHGCTAIRSCRLLTEPREPAGAGDDDAHQSATTTAVGERSGCLTRLRLIDLADTGIPAASAADAVAALRRQCPLLTKVYLNGDQVAATLASATANVWKKTAAAPRS